MHEKAKNYYKILYYYKIIKETLYIKYGLHVIYNIEYPKCSETVNISESMYFRKKYFRQKL